MSKISELTKYILLTGSENKRDAHKLIEENRVIFGDFIGRQIYQESNTWMPKEGILIIEDESLVFFGAKSIFEKEFFIRYPLEFIEITQTNGFVLNFKIKRYGYKSEKLRFSISWQDFFSKNIKNLFISNLEDKIYKHLTKLAKPLLDKSIDDDYSRFLYERVLTSTNPDNEFLEKYLKLIVSRSEFFDKNGLAFDQSYIESEKKILIDRFPDKNSLIKKILDYDEVKKTYGNSFKGNINETATIYFDNCSLETDTIINHPLIRKIIDNEIERKTELIREQFYDEFEDKINEVSNKVELEKRVYRDILKDNFQLPNCSNITQEAILDIIKETYHRHLIVKELLPDNFSILKSKPQDGINQLQKIFNELSMDYVKIIDPYFFETEFKLLELIPNSINIKIISSSLLDKEYNSKLKQFEEALQKFRLSRLGKVEVKLIKYKNSSKTPIHDRAIFSTGWGITLSNSLSQIGNRHDIMVRRIYNHVNAQDNEFNDFWFINNDQLRNGKFKELYILNL
ncbi:MAG: hypothetical protein JXR48_16520 [Candidatus Delongbacteria bacterium]|nr:hypothetical protein [Candidatus Delongbacteria bacterium]MBN2836563.1 hypothetical protein [Candidatus Delongbacteria bacterium]